MKDRVSNRRRPLDVLAIQFWVHDPALIHRAVHSAGFDARIKRVDIEPALHAALGRQLWDLVIYDPATPGLAIETVQRCMKTFRRRAALVIIDDAATLAARVHHVLGLMRS